jgi:Transglutaminase-like superfamily
VLRKLLRLPVAERRLAFEAVALLIAVRVALVCISPLQLRRVLAWLRGRVPRHPVPAERVAWAVVAAARHLPGARDTCLVRALAAELLLVRHGHMALLRIGVARVAGRGITAHAWVESDGRIVLGAAERPAYTELPRLPRGPA